MRLKVSTKRIARTRQGSPQPAGRQPHIDDDEGEEKAEAAAEEGERQRHPHGFGKKPQIQWAEEARQLLDHAVHQKILARTRNAQRPNNASDSEAMNVSRI